MADSSRTINHKLNELLSKTVTKAKLDVPTSLSYASTLKANILGKDKQEKVNSIVVLAKLLDCVVGAECASNDFSAILDHSLFQTLFSIVSSNMSTETYKAILKISVIVISGSIFRVKDDSITKYLPLYESLIEYLDVIDIITQKLYFQDNKITYNTIKLVTDLIVKALKFQYSGIITLAGRLKHVTLFSTVSNLIETEDRSILDSIEHLKVAYFDLNEYLNGTKFDLSIKAHQVMLNNLFIFLEVSLNEYGTPAKTEEYVKAGFTDNPRKFVVDNFSILLAMDLKIFLKDPNMVFKKRFHEELMMSSHNRTFPLNLFIGEATDIWLEVFHQRELYPNIYSNILSWELMIFYTMNSFLILWQQTKASLNSKSDVEKIAVLIKSNIFQVEESLGDLQSRTIEECLDLTATKTFEDMRTSQVQNIKHDFSSTWERRLAAFDANLAREVMDFVCEQRVIQLLKGSWVYTDAYGEFLLKAGTRKPVSNKYYFILLSPNRLFLYYKEFPEKSTVTPSYEEMESQSIRLADISDFKSNKIGEQVGEEDKKKNTKLISIKGTISYEKITLVDKKGNKLLSFYTDTQVNKYVWLDGLKMLKGITQTGALSEETERQLSSLSEIRKNTQLLSLDSVTADDDDDSSSDDDEYYNMSELVNISTEPFHYK